MRKDILFIILLGLFTSCSATKPSTLNLNELLLKNNSYVEIPLSKSVTGHLHLEVILNGVKGDFILDTGAGVTLVDPKKKDKYKLKINDKGESAVGAGGKVSLQNSKSNKITISSLKKENFTLHVMSIDHVNNAFKSMGLEEVDGILGADILTSNKGIIDYSNLILYLKN